MPTTSKPILIASSTGYMGGRLVPQFQTAYFRPSLSGADCTGTPASYSTGSSSRGCPGASSVPPSGMPDPSRRRFSLVDQTSYRTDVDMNDIPLGRSRDAFTIVLESAVKFVRSAVRFCITRIFCCSW
jgi:hypothetical protein